MAHAAESTHWYTRKGEPAYTVKAKAGHDRPTTLADARKLGLVPSVTTIIRSAAAPGLERWKQNQVLLAALTLPRIQDEPEAAYIARIVADSQEQAKKAAERGTAIHAAIQGHFENEAPEPELWPYVDAAKSAVENWAGGEWIAERPFSHPMGFGGKVDLCGTQDCIIDFKTKEFGPEDKLQTWDEHAMQLAAYRFGLGMDSARCAIVYVSTTTPRLAKLLEIEQDDIARGWECFKALLTFWQAKNRFNSAYQVAKAA